jgi:P27 family predicted phage terminase small subunit
MAKGRPRIPTTLKVLNGNPGKRPISQTEPKPEPIAPKCPPHLDRRAKAEWRRIAPELEELGLLTRVDMAALAGYCQNYSLWIDAHNQIKKHGLLIKSPNGYPMQSPYLAIANKALDHMKSFLTEFGMTPASRTRINVKTPEKEVGVIKKYLSG